MKFLVRIAVSIVFLAGPVSSFSQDSLLTEMAKEHHTTFTYDGESFSGEGWDNIIGQVQSTKNVLIGEDHFTNEVPAFAKAVLEAGGFDNFVIEVDPYSTEIIENSLKDLSQKERKVFNEKYKSHFSFYGLKPEYELLTQAVGMGVNLLGAEQIVKFGDRLILQELAKITDSEEAGKIYKEMMNQSKAHYENFLKDSEQPMYFMTPHFKRQLNKLENLSLSDMEKSTIEDLKISRNIYEQNDHKKRIQLMKHILLNRFSDWYHSKNLFKYGGVHMPRGESLLRIFDVGNLVSNVSDARFDDSYHLLVIAKSGMKGAPFPNFPGSRIDPSKGMLSNLSPFFSVVEESDWYAFEMLPLRQSLRNGNLDLKNVMLERVIKGYDTLVIIPEATAAEF